MDSPSEQGRAPRLLIEVLWGKQGGERAAIAAGESLTVGRTSRADFVVGSDRQLSGVHFELSWDGESCRVVDRDSARGIAVDGEALRDGSVGHGGWIRAGETDFQVFVEGGTRAPLREPADDAATVAAKARALAALRGLGDQLYCVVDASRDNRVLGLLREHVDRHASLYEGLEGAMLRDVAPHLVKPRADSRLLEHLVDEGWGERWCIHLTSSASFERVRRHLRRFLVAIDADAKEEMVFRFYDPHVLTTFFDVISAPQHELLHREVAAYFVDDREQGIRRLGEGRSA